MDLKQLSYFRAVADAGSISAAAKILHISQPPLSAQMHKLEAELGCLLFERGARKISLTQPGRLLYERAGSILSLCDATLLELQDHARGAEGTLRLGAVSSVSSTVMISWLDSFHTAFPNIRFELSEGNTYQLLDMLDAGLIELAIVRSPFSHAGLQRVSLQPEPLIAVGHRRFLGEESAPLSLAEVCAFPLILYRRWEQILTDLLRSRDLTASILCKCDDARTAIHLADSAMGVSIVPYSARTLLRNPEVTFRSIGDEALSSGIAVIRSTDRYLSSAGKAFLQHVQAIAEQP